MAENSKIEWCDHTFNPWIGCMKVSPACKNCYAEAQDIRLRGGAHWGAHSARTRTSPTNWKKPLVWNKKAKAEGVRPKVFCASLADVFDNSAAITSGWHGDLWHLIDATPHLDWLLLTKRPQNIKKMLPESYGMPEWGDGWDNVWLGTTAENQAEADRRIPFLLDVPAKVRFLSCEPLLGPLRLDHLDAEAYGHDKWCQINALTGSQTDMGRPCPNVPKIDWVIAGGESGPNARPSHPDWFRSLRDQCAAADVPFFFKQWGEWLPAFEFGNQKIEDDEELSRFKSCVWLPESQEFELTNGLWTDQENWEIATDYTAPEQQLFRVGKKAAGRLFDGVEHSAFPQGGDVI